MVVVLKIGEQIVDTICNGMLSKKGLKNPTVCIVVIKKSDSLTCEKCALLLCH